MLDLYRNAYTAEVICETSVTMPIIVNSMRHAPNTIFNYNKRSNIPDAAWTRPYLELSIQAECSEPCSSEDEEESQPQAAGAADRPKQELESGTNTHTSMQAKNCSKCSLTCHKAKSWSKSESFISASGVFDNTNTQAASTNSSSSKCEATGDERVIIASHKVTCRIREAGSGRKATTWMTRLANM